MKRNKIALVGAGVLGGITGIASLIVKTREKRKADKFIGTYYNGSKGLIIEKNGKEILGQYTDDGIVWGLNCTYDKKEKKLDIVSFNESLKMVLSIADENCTVLVGKQISIFNLNVEDNLIWYKQGVK